MSESPENVTFRIDLRATEAKDYLGELEAILGQFRVRMLLEGVADQEDIHFSYDIDVRGLEPGAAAFHSMARLFEIDPGRMQVDKEQLERLREIFSDLLQSVDRIEAARRKP